MSRVVLAHVAATERTGSSRTVFAVVSWRSVVTRIPVSYASMQIRAPPQGARCLQHHSGHVGWALERILMEGMV